MAPPKFLEATRPMSGVWSEREEGKGPQDPQVLRLRDVFLEFRSMFPKSPDLILEVKLGLVDEHQPHQELTPVQDSFKIVVELRAIFRGALEGRLIRALIALGERHHFYRHTIAPREEMHMIEPGQARAILVLEGRFNQVDVYSRGVGVKAVESEKAEKKPWNMRDTVITLTSSKLGKHHEATLGTMNDPEVKAALALAKIGIRNKLKDKKKAAKR